MRVGLAQFRPVLGDLQRNYHLHLEWIEKAKQDQVELLLFPELSLTGYCLLDLTYEVGRSIYSEEISQLVAQSEKLDLVFGFVELSEDHVLYNSTLYASKGKIVHTHRKVYLPTYGMFDEGRYFGRGEVIRSFPTQFGQMGILICEDMWHSSAPFLLAQDGAKMILVPGNSPVRSLDQTEVGSQSFWYANLENQAALNSSFFLFCNRVGTEDGISFFGGSSIMNPYGDEVARANMLEEQLLSVNIDLDEVRRSRLETPLLRDENLDLTIRELKRIRQSRLEQKRWI
ncbi:nitrilase-related carbon-nitrogen hydrolase [Shimazuella kribbensis]|uniref:nitrilase-related carbon-nitrogen hydrolase n=1 Tax=Shimazuella kribbensis TaxID=139808 RepID=UPI0003FB3432|nr:nitrilase-related carbon-nitrogen hydrolase [Shimazuella kribbensis]